MLDAVEIMAPLRGVWIGLKGLGRCHPFHEGGYDPVDSYEHVMRSKFSAYVQ